MMPRQFSRVQLGAFAFIFALATITLSLIGAAVVSEQPDDFIYTFEPDPIPITGTVTATGVPITGKQCFSSSSVFTVTSETWSYTLGPTAAPRNFQPFYTNAPATFSFEPDRRPLDINNCLVFIDQPQAPPEALTADLLANCSATPSMSFRLNAQAIDRTTGRTSQFVIRSSKDFTFPKRC